MIPTSTLPDRRRTRLAQRSSHLPAGDALDLACMDLVVLVRRSLAESERFYRGHQPDTRFAYELFPAHSRNRIRLTAGSRFRSARLKTIGRSTMPWIVSEYRAGSMVGTVAWCRSKCRSDGVMIHSSASSGVRDEPGISGDGLAGPARRPVRIPAPGHHLPPVIR